MSAPVLELDQVGLTYGPPHNVRVLDQISLRLHAGTSLAIVGPSGVGKSSLLTIMGLLKEPTEGRLRVEGVDTATLSERQRSTLRATTFGFIFQSFHLMNGRSALANIELGMLYTVPRSQRRARAEAATELLGIAHRAEHLPNEMSGGERQRVAIARAIANQPRVVFADEPTGNLDRASADNVMRALGEIAASGVAVVVVTHDPEVAQRCDRVGVMRDGRITIDASN